MVAYMYWVSALVFAIVLSIIYFNERRIQKNFDHFNKGFSMLNLWVIVFCIQDTGWGFWANTRLSNNMFFIASTVFHISTVLTTFFWLKYILSYLDDKIIPAAKNFIITLDLVVIGFQVVLLTVNFFTPTIFYIDAEGLYCTAFLRPLAFFNQYIVYVASGIFAGINAIRAKDEYKKKYSIVLIFALAPILTGIFQFMFPEAPFYSIGYFLGCFIIYTFLINNDRYELQRLQFIEADQKNQKKIEETIAFSYTDGLTGVLNRRAYENHMNEYLTRELPDDFLYVSIDVNGLKVANDTLGHAVGDEMLLDASKCLESCFGHEGTVYRIGGDEFVVIAHATQEDAAHFPKKLVQMFESWPCKSYKQLSMSAGFASYRDNIGLTVFELSKVADKNMYKSKSEYYSSKGVDRRGQQATYKAVCASYLKILKVDLLNDSYQVVHLSDSESEPGVEDNNSSGKLLSKWIANSVSRAIIHPDDAVEFSSMTNYEYIRSFFAEALRPLVVFYRRKSQSGYRKAMLELIPIPDYREDNQILYLYVKDIDAIESK